MLYSMYALSVSRISQPHSAAVPRLSNRVPERWRTRPADRARTSSREAAWRGASELGEGIHTGPTWTTEVVGIRPGGH
eukprot:COSAG02_NODE_4302_length_5530_cov_15.301970_4_plen_78_part_00